MFGLCCRFLLRLAARLTSALLEALEALLWPPACAMCGGGCGGAPDVPEGLCAACDAVVRGHAQGPRCGRCDALLPERANARHGCRACRGRPLEVTRVVALGPHEGFLRRAVLRLKSGGRASAAAPLGRLLARRVEALGLASGVDVVVAVPPSVDAEGRPLRALDHAALVARALAAAIGRPFVEGALERREAAHASQKSLERRDRWLAAKDAYRPTPGARTALAGRRVLVVDDVMTSGATVAACAVACRAAGAARVTAGCVTRQARRDDGPRRDGQGIVSVTSESTSPGLTRTSSGMARPPPSDAVTV